MVALSTKAAAVIPSAAIGLVSSGPLPATTEHPDPGLRSTRKTSGANGSLQQAAEDFRAGNIDNRRAAAGRRGKDGAAGVVKLADVKPQNGIAEPTIQPARLRDDRAGIGAEFELGDSHVVNRIDGVGHGPERTGRLSMCHPTRVNRLALEIEAAVVRSESSVGPPGTRWRSIRKCVGGRTLSKNGTDGA